MERWRVADALALRLIDHPESPSGKRPRFALTTEQAGRLAAMREIDVRLTEAGIGHAWLHANNRAAPFAGKTPLAFMVAKQRAGIDLTLRHLNVLAMKKSLGQSRQRD